MEQKAVLQLQIDMPVKFVKGIGEYRARLLWRLGIRTPLDLMEYFPKSYMTRRVNPSLFESTVGDMIAFTALISWVDLRPTKSGSKILNVGVSDTKITLVCTWFRFPPHYEQLFKPGQSVWLSGTLSEHDGQLQLLHPDFELIADQEEELDFWKTREILPVYGLTDKLSQKMLRNLIYKIFELFAAQISERLPQELLDRYQYPVRKVALQKMHFGTDLGEIEQVRRRFAYEELFFSQLMWARHRYYHIKAEDGIVFENKDRLKKLLWEKLPFKLTSAQIKVIREIFADMCSARQMSRMVQGDVGSGKTIVSLFAMLLAVDNGYQAALMAPTEILAEQHYQNISKLMEGLPVKVGLLKGGNYKGKAQIKKDIAESELDIVIGTHALLQDDTIFNKLGFVAVDEQHRFGVEQRAKLARKSSRPDLLYLSATPIPRSLSMTVYGDLELSIIDELPPNRKAIQTFVRQEGKIDTVYNEVRKELIAGRQVYIVCPLVEESEKISLLDAERLYKYISTKIYPEYSTALLHGKMPARDKDRIMLAFKTGETRILVSTTVIEVGVDVPNATVMIVEHAERFGLAQLHQLRGRVGRGASQSYCYLIQHFPISAVARERLSTMNKTTDGFVIAEKDLELRGPGEFFGTEQSGMPRFKFASIIKDQLLLRQARDDAFAIITKDPDLQAENNSFLRSEYIRLYNSREELILY